MSRPVAGQIEERSAGSLELTDRRVRGVIPYGVESRDMGGWREIIEAGALNSANLDDLRAVVDHHGLPLAHYPGTLALEDRSDGLHWSFEPPASRQDLVEAISRGDIRGGSWRMRVAPGGDRWNGEVRHVQRIAALVDVSIVGAEIPAYPAASVEYRSQPNPAAGQEDNMADEAATITTEDEGAGAVEGRSNGQAEAQTPPDGTDDRSASEDRSQGRLRARDRRGSSDERRGLADEFRHRGFPGEVATMPWDEFESRAVTWSASVDLLSQSQRVGGPLGFDVRYAWPAFQRVGVGADVTSVRILQQTARSLAAATNAVRAIDAVTTKPETGSTINLVTVPMKQVATKQSGIPNVYLQSGDVNSTIETDLRLAINEGLDKLVLDQIATAGFQAPGTDNFYVSVRKAMTTLFAAGYNPDLLILTPADAQTLDTMVSGISGGTADFVNGPGEFSGNVFSLAKRISKTIPASAVVDSTALGKLYAGPVSLAKFEENFGQSNSSTVRLELNAVFGLERVAAAVRIAAS